MARVPTLLIVSLLSAGAAFAQTAPPTQNSIRVVMNRVHGYLLTAAPLRPVDADHGRRGLAQQHAAERRARAYHSSHRRLRMGRHECGDVAGHAVHRRPALPLLRETPTLIGLARMAAHMRANYPDATADNFPPALSSTYSLRRVLFPRIPDEAGAQCAAWIKASRTGIASARLRPWIDVYANWMSTQQYRLS